MTYALLSLVAVASVGCLILYATWQAAEVKLAKAQGEIAKAKQELQEASSALDASQNINRDVRMQLELVIQQLKNEVQQCEANLPHDPASVRTRLQQLLSSTHSPLLRAKTFLASAYGTVSYGSPSGSRES